MSLWMDQGIFWQKQNLTARAIYVLVVRNSWIWNKSFIKSHNKSMMTCCWKKLLSFLQSLTSVNIFWGSSVHQPRAYILNISVIINSSSFLEKERLQTKRFNSSQLLRFFFFFFKPKSSFLGSHRALFFHALSCMMESSPATNEESAPKELHMGPAQLSLLHVSRIRSTCANATWGHSTYIASHELTKP